MPYDTVEKPLGGHKAFAETGDAAVLSQAAQLLLLGNQLRADYRALSVRAAVTGKKSLEAIPKDHLREFPVPRLGPYRKRVALEEVHSYLQKRHGISALREPTDEGRLAAPEKALPTLAKALSKERTPVAAARLMEACLRHPHELPRVAAAAAYFDLTSQPVRLLKILEDGVSSDDHLVRHVAATALAHVAPEHPSLAGLAQKSAPRGGEAGGTSILVHGTFAQNSPWWQPPDGDFFKYIKAGVWPDLYGTNPDKFQWSGGYSDAARSLAADELLNWVSAHGFNGLAMMGHSHGGNVAMLASHGNVPGNGALRIRELVLLSCPVHVPKYTPNFGPVEKVVSIRVKLDLVILADRGGQHFSDRRINEHVLPIWFNHFATHDPAVWQKYDVPAML